MIAAALLGVILGASVAVQAQTTTTQRYTFLGWTSTGNETVSKVTVGTSGLSAEGDPVKWSYTVLEIADPSGITHFKVGQHEGAPQKYWDKAKPEQDGVKRLETMGLREAIEGTVSPDGQFALVTMASSERGSETAITADCPGCAVCNTQLTVLLFNKGQRKVHQISQKSHTGNPFPPDAPTADCPDVTARGYWHPENNQLAIVYDKTLPSSGEQSQRLDNYTLPSGVQSMAAWPLPTSSSALEREAREARITEKKNALRTLPAEDRSGRATILAELGDLQQKSNNFRAAKDYYNSALEFDRKNTLAALGQATLLLLEGDGRSATRAIRQVEAADRRKGNYSADIGLFYLVQGNLDKAQKFLQRAVDQASSGGSGVGFPKRLELGHRILDADLEAGIAYMDNLFAGAPDDPDPALAKQLTQAYIRAADESIHLGDLQTALRYLPKLDPKSDTARRLALTISALTPNKATLALERVDILLAENPADCGLHLVRGLAWKRLTKPANAFESFAAAAICDPGLAEAHIQLADMYSLRGQIALATAHYKDYRAFAPRRKGDPVSQQRHDRIDRLLPRLGHKGVILLSHACNPQGSAVRCTGILLNTSPSPSGKVDITMTATDRRKRAAGQRTVSLPNIAPGTSLDFNITLDASDAENLSLTAGRTEPERTINQTTVRINPGG